MKPIHRGILKLDNLGNGLPGITKPFGATLAEAAAVCLEQQGHASGVTMEVNGAMDCSYDVCWPEVTEQMRRCYNDLEVATENGAYAVAIPIVRELTGYTVVERSRKGTGFDYWLGEESELPFQNKARLEVSGIRRGNDAGIRARMKAKLDQTKPSDGILPAYAAVVEFSRPVAQVMVKR